MRGGARRPHARRTPCTLSVQPRAPIVESLKGRLGRRPASPPIVESLKGRLGRRTASPPIVESLKGRLGRRTASHPTTTQMGLFQAPLHKVSREREARTAVIDVGDVGPRCAVAVGAMTNTLDLVVHAFQGPIADAQPSPGEDALPMEPEGAGDFLERLQPAMGRPPEPLIQVGLRPG